MKQSILCLAILLGTVGCAQRFADGLEKAHAVAAKEADIATKTIVKIGCHAPLDAMTRFCEESTDQCRAVFYACPDVRSFIAAVGNAMATERQFRMTLEPIDLTNERKPALSTTDVVVSPVDE